MSYDVQMQAGFLRYLDEQERSGATIEKYRHDVRTFFGWLDSGGRELTHETVVEYKKWLLAQRYAVTSANSMLAALNSFFHYAGRGDCCVKLYRLQQRFYRPAQKELTRSEYLRLLVAANKKDARISLVLQTICSTGIRVSELQFITCEGIKNGRIEVSNKGKVRAIFLPRSLKTQLETYARQRGIRHGAIFLTRTGRPLDRVSIWRAMKNLCRSARVAPEKIFPHNLRHLFARSFYSMYKDLVKLADLLGHSSVNTTRIYTISTGDEHQKEIDKLSAFLTQRTCIDGTNLNYII